MYNESINIHNVHLTPEILPKSEANQFDSLTSHDPTMIMIVLVRYCSEEPRCQ